MIIDTPQGKSIAILFDFLDGPEPDLNTEILDLARQVSRLHQVMETYPYSLPHRGTDFYVDHYLDILQELDYPPRRIADLAAVGGECLRAGFCHGDCTPAICARPPQAAMCCSISTLPHALTP